MRNVEYRISDGKLIIEIDLNAKTQPSSSGKSNIVATTRGNQPLDIPNRNLRLGLNLYEPK
jgi:hypothetical protein